ncbi:hypothetical protein EVAR_83791_1 [Eumeta japonica]|uniref:Uncharacterized protein n=1 Tax=Eumeta variegata TaxID=151549 RepID=A0A4C1WH50_EUMVA|nr:hypothetical protein EVAR_83791_1 [Eumeta japonica]
MVDGSTVWKPFETVVLTFDGQMFPQRNFSVTMLYRSRYTLSQLSSATTATDMGILKLNLDLSPDVLNASGSRPNKGYGKTSHQEIISVDFLLVPMDALFQLQVLLRVNLNKA